MTGNKLWFCMISAFLCLGEMNAKEILQKADHYSKNSVMQTSLAEECFLSDLHLTGDEEILDVGCGEGKLTVQLAKQLKKGKITAIDKTTHMIDYAKKHNSNSNIDYLVMDVEGINKLNKNFDVIIVFSAFHWFENPKEALKKMSERLKKGGKIYIVTYPAESQDWSYYKEALLAKEKWANFFEKGLYESFFTLKDFEQEAKKLGLKIHKNQITDRFQTYSKIDDFKNCVKGWLEWFAPKLPQSEYDDYTDMVVEKGKAQFTHNKEGKILIPYKSITVVLEN